MSDIGLGRVKVEGTGTVGMSAENRARLEKLASDTNRQLVELKEATRRFLQSIADDEEITFTAEQEAALEVLERLLVSVQKGGVIADGGTLGPYTLDEALAQLAAIHGAAEELSRWPELAETPFVVQLKHGDPPTELRPQQVKGIYEGWLAHVERLAPYGRRIVTQAHEAELFRARLRKWLEGA